MSERHILLVNVFFAPFTYGGATVVAEQVAWRKAKSQQVGRTLSLAQPLWDLLARNVVYGFNRDGKAWCDWTESHAAPLAELFDYNRDQRSSSTTGTAARRFAALNEAV